MTPDTMARDILTRASAAGLSLSTAESCTGGMVAAALTEIAGSSAVFDRGFVTYSNAAKQQMLGVLPATLEAHGAVSEEVAREMAAGGRRAAGVDLCVAITGIAGPGGSDHKPEGRVCFGIAGPDILHSETIEFGPLGRAAVRQAATTHALALFLRVLPQKISDES